MADDPLTQTRLDVAEMKGMLSVAMTNQAEGLRKVENEQSILHTRVTEQAQTAARHGEQIADLDSRTTGQVGKVMTVVGPAIAFLALLLAAAQAVTPPG